MIAVSEKYALEVGSPTPIASERQHEEYLSVLDKLANKANPSSAEEKYAEVLLTLIEAYEEEVYGCLDANGRWVEPPRQLIITHQTVPRPTAALPSPDVATQARPERSPAPEPKKLINVDPTVLDMEKGA